VSDIVVSGPVEVEQLDGSLVPLNVEDLRGDPGPTGATGSPGATGATGATGPAGIAPVSLMMPASALSETYPRGGAVTSAVAAATSGRLMLYAIPLTAGQVVSTITFVSQSTALSGGTNQWFALYSAARAKLAVTGDDGATAWAATTPKSLTLTSAYTVPTTGLYYVGICVVASTPPTLSGVANGSWMTGLAPITAGGSTTGLTNPASAPSTAAAITATSGQAYAYVS